MNNRDFNFAYKVRHALNENLDNLPASTLNKLSSARNIALSRKKQDKPLQAYVPQDAYAGKADSFFNTPVSWINRMGLALPMIFLIAGLIGIYQSEQQQRISETAELDALVLADELPLSAYVDHGFNAYLAIQGD